MADNWVEFQNFTVGVFNLSVGDILMINGNICYVLNILVGRHYSGMINLKLDIPQQKMYNTSMSFRLKNFAYQLEDGKIKHIPSKKA